MKGILILAQPRSGSTNLLQSLARRYNLKWHNEPEKAYKFTPNNKLHLKGVKPSISVSKMILGQHDSLTADEYGSIIAPEYEEVVILMRRNLKEQTESFSYLLSSNNPTQFNAVEPWDAKKLDTLPKEHIDFSRRGLLSAFVDGVRLRDEYGFTQVWYEDIYVNRKFLHPTLELDWDYLDSTRRARVSIPTTLI